MVDASNILETVKPGGEASMHTEDQFTDQGSDWKAVENLNEGLPDPYVKPAPALVVKSVDATDAAALMGIPST